jgi:hypothetical protein
MAAASTAGHPRRHSPSLAAFAVTAATCIALPVLSKECRGIYRVDSISPAPWSPWAAGLKATQAIHPVERRRDGIATITFNRPDKIKNFVSPDDDGNRRGNRPNECRR